MELANRPLLVGQVVMGLVAWGALALAAWPAIARMERRRALRWLVAPQMFRYIGMSLLATGVAAPTMPPDFARWVATGDLVTSVLAIAAFVALGRPGRFGIWMCALVTIVGLADLVRNLVAGIQAGAADHLAGGWLVVALIVPGMAVAHVVALVRLRR